MQEGLSLRSSCFDQCRWLWDVYPCRSYSWKRLSKMKSGNLQEFTLIWALFWVESDIRICCELAFLRLKNNLVKTPATFLAATLTYSKVVLWLWLFVLILACPCSCCRLKFCFGKLRGLGVFFICTQKSWWWAFRFCELWVWCWSYHFPIFERNSLSWLVGHLLS